MNRQKCLNYIDKTFVLVYRRKTHRWDRNPELVEMRSKNLCFLILKLKITVPNVKYNSHYPDRNIHMQQPLHHSDQWRLCMWSTVMWNHGSWNQSWFFPKNLVSEQMDSDLVRISVNSPPPRILFPHCWHVVIDSTCATKGSAAVESRGGSIFRDLFIFLCTTEDSWRYTSAVRGLHNAGVKS